MNNEFKRLHENKIPPPEAKKDVLEEIHTYEMLSSMLELFTGDLLRTELNMFNIPEAAKKNKNNR